MKCLQFIPALLTITALSLSFSGTAAFMDVTSIDTIGQTASGTINGIAFTFRTTRVVTRPHLGDAGLVGGVSNSSSAAFNFTNFFTPALPLGDLLVLAATSDYKIEFAQPVSSLTLHLSQLEANRFSFTSGEVPVAFTLLSSDGDLIPSAGNTAIQGFPGGGNDANGSILFSGTFSELSWTSTFGNGTTANTADDGISFQVSVAPELPPYLNITLLGVQQARLAWSTNYPNYTLESVPILPAASWQPVTNTIVITEQQFSVAVDAGETSCFFRLHKN